MRDAVIGVIKNASWPYLRNYAVSLAKCGFEGDKVLFVDDITVEAIGKMGEGLCIGRRIHRYDNIVWCDVRDVMFQSDPSEWLAANVTDEYRLFGASEGCLIKDQNFNANWVQRTSPKDWEWMQNEVVCCSGTFAGDAEIMLDVFKNMYELHLSIEDPAAFDQGLWNFTARSKPFSSFFRIPKMKEGFCATGWPSKETTFSPYTTDKAPVWDWQEMVCYSPDTHIPFCIVHQYDREPAWASQIRSIFQDTDTPPIILIASFEAARHNGYNNAIRDTWVKDLYGRMPYKFVLGRECAGTPLQDDEIVVDAGDGREDFPNKTKAARAWATKISRGRCWNGWALKLFFRRSICGPAAR